jgi:ATP-dependent helicase/DNAse subunit B
MLSESALIEYQDALLELLASGWPQDMVIETLKTDPRFEPFQDYVKQFDPDMVAVACELMTKWARRKELD